MEITQLEQMIRWLDEERKQDKALIAALQERVEQQSHLFEAQSKDLQGLRQELVTVRTDVRRTDDYPSMIETTRRDLAGELESLNVQVRRERLEAGQNRRAEIEMLNDMIAGLDNRIRPLMRHEEQLGARAAGEQRTRRVGQLEGEIPGLRQRTDEQVVRLARLEDSIRKLPARVDEAIEVAKSYEARIEELRAADFQREQRVKKYLDQAEQVNEEVQRLVEQTQRYALLYNQNRQALDGLTAFEDRLERRQNEISEMQRLTEERLLRQWDEWQAAFARDWQKRVVAVEDRWRRQDLNNQQTLEHFTEVDEELELHYVELVALWEEVLADVERLTRAYQDIGSASRTVSGDHLKQLRRYGEEKHRQLV